MNISVSTISISIYSATLASAPVSSAPRACGGRTGGDGADDDNGADPRLHHGHRHHEGGRMGHALWDALRSLGLASAATPSGSAPGASPPSNATDPAGSTATDAATQTGTGGGASTVRGNLGDDLRAFMHALFEAIKGEGQASPSGAAGTEATSTEVDAAAASGPTTAASPVAAGLRGRWADFSGKLSGLTARVGAGAVPATLQESFDKLIGDLKGGASTVAAGATLPKLVELLRAMQQELGYPGTASGTSVGNAVSTTA